MKRVAKLERAIAVLRELGGRVGNLDKHRQHRRRGRLPFTFHLSTQSSFFAELREVVRREDSLRFDELIFQPSSILHRRLISETEEEDDDEEGRAAGGTSTAGAEVRILNGFLNGFS